MAMMHMWYSSHERTRCEMLTANNPGVLPKTVFDVLVLTLLLCLLLSGCASIPHNPNYYAASQQVEGASEQGEAHRCTDICWVMSARNDNYFEARVYILGQRVATLPGTMAKGVPIPVKRSMLDGSGCMEILVKLFPDTKTAYSSKVCPVTGSRLELAIADSYGEMPLHVWLQDWR